MGIPTQSPLAGALPRRPVSRQGLALPSAIFALVMVTVLLAGLYAIADLSSRAALNQERATRAVHVAEAGLTHAVGLLRGGMRSYGVARILKGSDNANSNASQRTDDSLFTGYGLPAGDQIPSTGKTFGGHTYWASVLDDPADGDANAYTDLNGRMLVRCWSVTSDGARAEVAAIVGALPMPGVVTDGNLEMSSKPKIMGACGSLHANGNVTGGGEPSVTAGASATGTIEQNTLAPQKENQPAMNVPDLNPADFWGSCTHFHGSGMTLGSGTPVGTHCVTGNVQSSGDFGDLNNMKAITIIATGYIKISSKPFIKAHHPDGLLLVAGGDLDLQGDWGGEGLLYAEGFCYISSKPKINGSLLCKSKASAPGTLTKNEISGEAEITFDCSTNGFNKRRVLFWYPRMGT